MARDMSYGHYVEAGKVANPSPWIWLFEIQVPTDPATMYRMTSHDEPVQFGENPDGDPLEFLPAPIAHQGVPESADGSLPKLSITLQDTLGIAAATVDQYEGLVGQPVYIQVVHKSQLEFGDPAQAFRGEISSSSVTDDGPRVAIEVSAVNIYQTSFPARVYTKKRFPGLRR